MREFLGDLWRCLFNRSHSFMDARTLMAAMSIHGVRSVAENCSVCGGFHIRERA